MITIVIKLNLVLMTIGIIKSIILIVIIVVIIYKTRILLLVIIIIILKIMITVMQGETNSEIET